MPETDTGKTLRRGLRNLVVAQAVLYLVVSAALVFVWRDSSNKRRDLQREEVRTNVKLARTNTALCTLRHDLEQRVNASKDFLIAHPDGIPGISAATIQSSITSQQRTIKALSSLVCVT